MSKSGDLISSINQPILAIHEFHCLIIRQPCFCSSGCLESWLGISLTLKFYDQLFGERSCHIPVKFPELWDNFGSVPFIIPHLPGAPKRDHNTIFMSPIEIERAIFHSIVKKVEHWLFLFQSLPKTKTKFLNSIQSLCSVVWQLDEGRVLQYLADHRILRAEGDQVEYNKEILQYWQNNVEWLKLITEENHEGESIITPSNPEQQCLHKIARWLVWNSALPSSRIRLLNCLHQQGKLRVYVSPQCIFEHFCKLGDIAVDEQGNMIYPHLTRKRPTKRQREDNLEDVDGVFSHPCRIQRIGDYHYIIHDITMDCV